MTEEVPQARVESEVSRGATLVVFFGEDGHLFFASYTA